MKHILFSLFILIMLAGCGTPGELVDQDAPVIQASPARSALQSVSTVTASPTATSTPDVYSALYPSQTALALYEQQLVQQEQALQLQLVSDSATSTAVYAITQNAIVNVQSTEAAKTSVAGTQTAYPLTQTPIAATQQIEYIRYRSSQFSAGAFPVLGLIALFALIVFLVILGRKVLKFLEEYGEAKNLKAKTEALKPDDQGRFALVPSKSLKTEETLINPNLAHRAVINPLSDDLTTEQALANTEGARGLESMRLMMSSPLFARTASRNLIKTQAPNGSVMITKPDAQNLLALGAGAGSMPALPALNIPHWKLLNKWDGHYLPYGVDENEKLMLVNPVQRPHMLFSGMSGSWKSRSGIRTLISGALTSGWNVFVVGKQVDYFPFEDHPNFKILALNLRTESKKWLELLNRLTDQMDIRDNILVQKRVSTWDRYGAPQTMIVLDDFTGAMFSIPRPVRPEVQEELLRIANDGRKFGLNLVLGVQRPTATSVNSDLLSQMARISFRVGTALESRIAIGEEGAERLPELHYITKLNDESRLERGVGFRLEDVEVVTFLSSRPVQQNEPMDWIDAVVTDVTDEEQKVEGGMQDADEASETIIRSTQPSTLPDAYQTASPEVKIRKSYLNALNRKDLNLSLSMIELDALGYRGGAAARKVKEVLARYEGCEQSEIADVLQGKVDEWKSDRDATTTATEPEKGNLTPDSLVVAG